MKKNGFTVREFFNLRGSGIYVAWIQQQHRHQRLRQVSMLICFLESASVKTYLPRLSFNKLTGFLHFEHVTDPQSGQIKRRCFGRAKKPDEHFEGR